MSRKRSAYRPRAFLSSPLALLRPASAQQADGVMCRFYAALDAMARGRRPGELEWRDLSDAINTVETLATHLGKLPTEQVMPLVHAAIAAMARAAERFKAGQGMRLDEPGLHALQDVLDVYAECLRVLTEREMSQAVDETQRRVHALLRGVAAQPDHVVIAL